MPVATARRHNVGLCGRWRFRSVRCEVFQLRQLHRLATQLESLQLSDQQLELLDLAQPLIRTCGAHRSARRRIVQQNQQQFVATEVSWWTSWQAVGRTDGASLCEDLFTTVDSSRSQMTSAIYLPVAVVASSTASSTAIFYCASDAKIGRHPSSQGTALFPFVPSHRPGGRPQIRRGASIRSLCQEHHGPVRQHRRLPWKTFESGSQCYGCLRRSTILCRCVLLR